jgi:hypothetical protein
VAGKIPTVHRCLMTGALTGESAYKWAMFLADEYSFDSDDPLLYDVFKAMAESLEPKPGKASVASFTSHRLEKEILKWTQSTD